MAGPPYVWGATAAEHARGYPADTLLDGAVIRLTRAVTVAAPPALTYRWICQIRLAPYSYDRLDNGGRRSPSELTPGADRLAPGDEVMVFTLTEVDDGRSYTGRGTPRAERIFGRLAGTYAVEPVGAATAEEPATLSRLLCRLVLARPAGVRGLAAGALAWGDLVMMRKQLLTLKAYAERDAVRSGAVTPGRQRP